METLLQSTKIYLLMVVRRMDIRPATSLQEWTDVTYLLRLNEWEETAICLSLIADYQFNEEMDRPICQWLIARVKELKSLYPYVLHSFQQGVPATLRDL